MTQSPVMLLVALFRELDAADRALAEIKTAQKAHLIAVQDVAVVRRDENSRLHIEEPADPGGGRGAVAGGLMGLIIGLLAGPAGAIVAGAAGAIVGGVTARVIDSGIPDDRLRQIGQALTPGASAIVAIVEHSWLEEVQRLLVEAGADVLVESLRADIGQQLQAAQDPAASPPQEPTAASPAD